MTTDAVNEQSDAQLEAEEQAAALAGYNRTSTRAEEAPAETVKTEQADDAEPIVADTELIPQPEPEMNLADELKLLKAKVAASTSDPETMRKMHGDIGEINRTLKKLQASEKKPDAPVNDELTAALEAAENVAKEFPEIAEPLVKAIKAMGSTKQRATGQEPVDIDARVSDRISKALEEKAVSELKDEHPDYRTIMFSADFDSWVKTKAPELQDRIRHTESSAAASRYLTEYKNTLQAKQKKQDRLEAAVVTKGTQQQAKPSILPDEEGAWIGYNKGRKRQ